MIPNGTYTAVIDAVYRPKETEARANAAQSQFDRLSKRPPKDE